ncbi:MAG: hypothetical protein ACRD2L_14775, partial [Terriglobia bacterium]
AFRTDFLGEWDLDYDPLISLKEVIRELREAKAPWWRLKSKDLVRKVQYPVTKSADEWAKEIQSLDKLLNEGLETKELRQQAERLGRTIDDQWKSLKLTEEVLLGLGYDADQVQEILAPLRELSALRNKVSAHASDAEAKKRKKQILKEHGSFVVHFRSLCKSCDETMGRLRGIFDRKVYGLTPSAES